MKASTLLRKFGLRHAAALMAAGWGVALALCGGAIAADRGFKIETATLDNGLQIVVLPNHRAPIVMHMVWYKVGGGDESPGKSGIAHFLEHLMFKGTPSVPPGEFSKIVARNGGRDNAFTSYDYTGYHQTIAADRLELVIKMEADRMANLVLSDAQLLPERDVVLEERRQRIDNVPAAVLDEITNEAMYGTKGYGIPLIGYAREIAKLERQDAEIFYRAHYAPNNAILIVAGDVTLATVKPLAEKYYGPVARRAVPARSRPLDVAVNRPLRVEHRDPQVRQAEWSRDYVAPSYKAGESKHAIPLQVLAQILGGNQTSRLFRVLVEDRKLATSANASYSAASLGLSSFGLGASLAPGATMADLEAAMDGQIKELIDKGVSEDELKQAKNRLIAASVYARDSLGTGPRIYGGGLVIGRTIEEIERWPDDIEAVTAAQVLDAARATLVADRSVTSLLLPQKGPGG